MAATVTINGTTYNELTSAFSVNSPTAGSYVAIPPFGPRPMVGMRQHNEAIRAIPGVQTGVGTMRFAPLGRPISVTLICIDSSENNAHSRAQTLLDSLDGYARYNVTILGKQYTGCKLTRGSMSGDINCLHDKYAIVLSLEFTQLQES